LFRTPRYVVTRYTAHRRRKLPFSFDFRVKEAPRAAEHRRFAEKAARGHEEVRTQRLKDLRRRRSSITDAIKAYEALDQGGTMLTVHIRSAFVRLATPRPARNYLEEPNAGRAAQLQLDWDSRPPCMQLIRRAGNALPLYLTALYLAHLDARPGGRGPRNRRNMSGGIADPAWATLCGMGFGVLRARAARVNRALRMLRAARLVALPGTDENPAFEGWVMLKEDGREENYTVPGARTEAVIPLSAGFFRSGWHLVLKPKEIALLLAITDESRRRHRPQPNSTPGIALPQSVRWSTYGISPEVYEAAHELQEFGLVTIHDTMPGRRRGKLPRPLQSQSDSAMEPVPYRFTLPQKVFDRHAYDVVTESLARYPRPPRYS
jgi:hypothetical protein